MLENNPKPYIFNVVCVNASRPYSRVAYLWGSYRSSRVRSNGYHRSRFVWHSGNLPWTVSRYFCTFLHEIHVTTAHYVSRNDMRRHATLVLTIRVQSKIVKFVSFIWKCMWIRTDFDTQAATSWLQTEPKIIITRDTAISCQNVAPRYRGIVLRSPKYMTCHAFVKKSDASLRIATLEIAGEI